MTDLDTALRTMLRERATDIDTRPADFNELKSLDVLDRDPIHDLHRGHRTRWLIAAAVIAVLAVVGTVTAIQSGGNRRDTPPVTRPPITSPLTSPSATTAPSSPHAVRGASLAWFGMRKLPGYELGLRTSAPGYRQLGVKPANDPDLPAGSNGGATWTAYITVYDKGRFNVGKVAGWQHLSMGSAPGYLGTLPWVGGEGSAHTLAWQYGSGQWAIVQGLTAATSGDQSLLAIAEAVEPTVSAPMDLPFRLDYVPELPVTKVIDSRPDGYSFTMSFGRVDSRSFEIALSSQDPNGAAHTPVNRRTIDGLTGYYDGRVGVADVAVHGSFVELRLGQSDGKVTAADRSDMAKVLSGLHWANGDGGAPLIPAEQAIP